MKACLRDCSFCRSLPLPTWVRVVAGTRLFGRTILHPCWVLPTPQSEASDPSVSKVSLDGAAAGVPREWNCFRARSRGRQTPPVPVGTAAKRSFSSADCSVEPPVEWLLSPPPLRFQPTLLPIIAITRAEEAAMHLNSVLRFTI